MGYEKNRRPLLASHALDASPLGLPAGLVASGVGPAQATRILRAASKGTSPIAATMASAPVYTNRGSSSSIYPSAGGYIGGGRYDPLDANHVQQIGGALGLVGTDYKGVAMSSTPVSSPGTRRGGHGSGIRFMTDAPAFDIAANTVGNPFCGYVTDPVTGIRQRFQAADQVTTTGSAFHEFAFGSAALRIVELYYDPNMLIRNINVAANYSIWSASSRYADEPKIAALGDSWDDGVVTGGTNLMKLAVDDYMGEHLGCPNIIGLSRGGTGYLSPNGNLGTYIQRIRNDDLNPSRIGALDALWMPASLNDSTDTNAAFTDAAITSAITATISAARAVQPTAIILVSGPQLTVAHVTAQSRFDAVKAGVLAANDANTIYLDNSPSGENWMSNSAPLNNNSLYLDGADHPAPSGVQWIGYRRADSIISNLKTKYGL